MDSFEPLQHLIDHMIKEGFIDEKYQKLAPLYDTKESLIEGLKHYKTTWCTYIRLIK